VPHGPNALGGRLLVCFLALMSICLLYRYGPSRRGSSWQVVWPGAAAATVVWVTVSGLFSWYVGHVATYDATYGPLGAVVGLMMWFYVSAFCVLAGAEFNAACERQLDARNAPGGAPAPRPVHQPLPSAHRQAKPPVR
jgi:membrane protein